MTCSYCRYLNLDDERRCRRCGRPLADVYAMATTGSLATMPELAVHEPVAAPVAQPAPPIARPAAVAPPRQPMLFHDRPGNVIAFDGVYEAPAPVRTRPPATRNTTRTVRRPSVPNDAQPSLDFPPALPTPKKLSTTVDAVIDCDAPVANLMHRACAAAVDASWIVIACGFFFTAFHLLGGRFPATKTVTMIMATAPILIAMFYGFIWVWAGGQTPGMRKLHLTLINFDGYPPDASARWLRYISACLGYFACGLGLLWALLDEESLAWHDHISKTFPTFHGPETSFVRRR